MLTEFVPPPTGGITPSNARTYLDAGASHVIVTSFVFRDGRIDRERLAELVAAVGGPERLVLDLSCRKHARAAGVSVVSGAAGPGAAVAEDAAFEYVVVTDRWQRWTDVVVNAETLRDLSAHCESLALPPPAPRESYPRPTHFGLCGAGAEFLVHGVDVEGLRAGIEDGLVRLLGAASPIPVTYAGGVRDLGDMERIRVRGGGAGPRRAWLQ